MHAWLYNYNVTVHNTTNYSSGGQARDLVAQLQLGSMVESVAQGYLHEQEYLHEAIIIRGVFLLTNIIIVDQRDDTPIIIFMYNPTTA